MAADLLTRVHHFVDATIRRERLDLDADDLFATRVEHVVPAPVELDDGAVHADLIPDDDELFGELLELLPRPWSAEVVAAVAQEWRLPVLPYRRRPTTAPAQATREQLATDSPGPLDRRLHVVELTTMWAGPLAGYLLAVLDDAEVVRIVHPERGEPAAYRHLDIPKAIAPLDLTRTDDAARVRELIGRADVLISNFSRRVLPNLGLDAASLRILNPGLVHLDIAAFAVTSTHADWLAFGAGIHACSGLADRGDGGFERAPFSYPDPLAALDGYLRVRRAIFRSEVGRIEVNLHDTVAPLLSAS